MKDHTEPRRGRFMRGFASRKVRAVRCLGIFAAPAAVCTMASWTDEAIIESSEFTAGTLDLTVGGSQDLAGLDARPVIRALSTRCR